MDNEVKEKLEVSKSRKSGGITLTLHGIPQRVHSVIQKYQTKIIGERGRKFTIKQAYVEWLKQSVTTSK